MSVAKFLTSKAIKYSKYGDPREVLELVTEQLSTELDAREVLVKWLLSPVNPLDINKVQGTYAIRLPLPATGGTEACGRVMKVGSDVRNLCEGDLVMSQHLMASVWSQYSKVDNEDLIPLHKDTDLRAAATMLVNPVTAVAMLREFVTLSPGDVVIQNSANSGVGRAVIQVAHAYGYKTINIVRDRPEIAKLKKELKESGADWVFTEEEWTTEARKMRLPRPRLALNGVGGRSSLAISSALELGGICVTYGGMSKKPHEFSTSALVFNDIKSVGFAVGLWLQKEENAHKKEPLYQEVQKLALEGRLTAPPMEEHPIHEFRTAIANSMDGKHGKQLLVLHPQEQELKARL